jgi:hypothetical protein
VLGVALRHGKHEPVVEQAVTPPPQHLAVDVGEHDAAGLADTLRKLAREIACPAGDVEDALACAHHALLDREALPHPVQAQRHEVVHHVVAARDRIEDAGDALRLFVFGHFLVAEVGGLFHGSLPTFASFSRFRYCVHIACCRSP